MKEHFDKRTKEWFKLNPIAETTVMQCDKCGLSYKPILGHICEKVKKERKQQAHPTEKGGAE